MFYQFLCINGHYYSYPYYQELSYSYYKEKCPDCSTEQIQWRNLVTETNGAFMQNGKFRYPGEIRLLEKGKDQYGKIYWNPNSSDLTDKAKEYYKYEGIQTILI